jgi:hypothetical protein
MKLLLSIRLMVVVTYFWQYIYMPLKVAYAQKWLRRSIFKAFVQNVVDASRNKSKLGFVARSSAYEHHAQCLVSPKRIREMCRLFSYNYKEKNRLEIVSVDISY